MTVATAIVRCENNMHPLRLAMGDAGELGGARLRCRDHSTMRMHHSHMQDLLIEHTAFDVTMQEMVDGYRDDGPSVGCSDTNAKRKWNMCTARKRKHSWGRLEVTPA
jgi:hypothetical protein